MLSSAARFGIVHCAIARKRSTGGGDSPVNTTAPVVSPPVVEVDGVSFVSTTDGVWTGAGISYTYQWFRDADDTPLVGQTGPTIPADQLDPYVNTVVYVVVTATNVSGSVSARSSNTCYIAFPPG